MKLLLCNNCGDVFNLKKQTKSCGCGQTTGCYSDNLNATYSGKDAVPLGFANFSFRTAIDFQPENGKGEEFTAFVIPKKCDSFINKTKLVDGGTEQN